MEKVTCIICEKNNFHPYLEVFNKEEEELFYLEQCSCSLVLTSPRPSEQDIKKYYDENYLPHLKSNRKRYFLDNFFKYISYSWKKNLIKKYMYQAKNALLDIGGGDGSFAIHLKKYISSISVFDASTECVRFINKNDVYASDDLKDFPDNKFNIITLWHSLEHIHRIDNLFFNINRVSVDGAIMIIATPNRRASEIKFFSSKWIAWDVPRHLYHFSYEDLDRLLKKYNWKVISHSGIKQDTLFNIFMSLNGPFLIKIFPALVLSMYALIFQLFSKKRVSSNLLVCQKNI